MEDNLLTLFEVEIQREENKPTTYIDPNIITLKSDVIKDNYTDYISSHFDLEVEGTCEVQIPNKLKLDRLEDWNIGVICGASGSGKSTILKKLGGGSIAEAHFDNSKCLISNFDTMTPQEATMLLTSMGLASVPTWIRPYNVLSNGEKYRAELAKIVAESKEDIILIDEYTSVVDRNVAMSMSNALQKYIRKNNKKIILATCHYDIFDWLQPDWIYDLNKGGVLEEGECLRQGRPKIEIQMYRTTLDTWDLFKKHHYMTEELNKSSMCWVATWEDKMVGFCSILPLPSGTTKNAYRFHRIVVLPDFQGLGIGKFICEFFGAILANEGKSIYLKTINAALGEYLTRSDKWNPTSHNGRGETEEEASRMMGGLTRPSYCFKYSGPSQGGFENLILPIEQMKRIRANEGQLTLF